MKLIVLVLGFINLIVFVKTQEIGESCIMSNTRRPGICEELTKCKAVKDTYSHTAPTKCHIGQQRIVCCPIPHQSLIDSDPENRISSQSKF